jgi:hypothetical protein
MMTILSTILILLTFIWALPIWQYSRRFGYAPCGFAGISLIGFVILRANGTI